MSEDIWCIDASTLREVVLDRNAMLLRLEEAPPLERVWMLAMLGRLEEASREGEDILEHAKNKYRPLLLLAYVRMRQFDWAHAACLQEGALQRTRGPVREAEVRHQIGRRLFEEGRLQDAAKEFQWAYDLLRVNGRPKDVVDMSRLAMERSYTLSRRNWDEI